MKFIRFQNLQIYEPYIPSKFVVIFWFYGDISWTSSTVTSTIHWFVSEIKRVYIHVFMYSSKFSELFHSLSKIWWIPSKFFKFLLFEYRVDLNFNEIYIIVSHQNVTTMKIKLIKNIYKIQEEYQIHKK